MRKRVLAVLAVACLAGVPAAQAVAGPSAGPVATAAKSCSAGFTHAVIGGAEKCLRRGEFCARASDREYQRYGYRCVQRDANGSYHLT
jgi:curli biogenesis system outer membrane secretion channel CsgG